MNRKARFGLSIMLMPFLAALLIIVRILPFIVNESSGETPDLLLSIFVWLLWAVYITGTIIFVGDAA